MKILAIETSCDETGICVLEFKNIKNKAHILFNALSSQEKIHAKTSGIVPEIASRIHSEILPLFLKQVNKKIGLKNLDYIATTNEPGLLGSLLVGNNFAKTLAYLYKKPMIGVNHIIGHFYSPFIKLPLKKIRFPALGLIVSGGHTLLLLAKNKNNFKIIGETRDDAAGEAFDKIAKLLSLGYPGGPAISKAATKIKKSPFIFTVPMLKSQNFDFSFSGLKTEVRRTLEKMAQQHHPEVYAARSSYLPAVASANWADAGGCRKHCGQEGSHVRQQANVQYSLNEQTKSQIAFSAQKTIVDSLVKKSFSAVAKFKPKIFILGGGVAANNLLREELTHNLTALMPKENIYLPQNNYSTDNAPMIALAAYLNPKKSNWQNLKTSPNNNL